MNAQWVLYMQTWPTFLMNWNLVLSLLLQTCSFGWTKHICDKFPFGHQLSWFVEYLFFELYYIPVVCISFVIHIQQKLNIMPSVPFLCALSLKELWDMYVRVGEGGEGIEGVKNDSTCKFYIRSGVTIVTNSGQTSQYNLYLSASIWLQIDQ